MSEEIVIKVENVSKTFMLPHEKTTSIKSAAVNFYRRNKSFEMQEALKNVSFEIKKGEFYGIVGRNGSGKSTLLKILAGIYTPSNGAVHVAGKLTPFIELGVGFNPELTGRENVFLNGALLGFSRKEVLKMYDDIVNFAEIERFMDQKLKNYSSGMQVRLAFSIAIRAESDILLIDEVLAVGDAAFQAKCFEVFKDLKRQKRTIVLVTHDMANVERFCDRALVINNGDVLGVSQPHEAAATYARLNVEEGGTDAAKPDPKSGGKMKNRWGSGEIRVKEVTFASKGEKTSVLSVSDDMKIEIRLARKTGFEKTPIVCGLAFYNDEGVNLAGPNTQDAAITTGVNKFTYYLPEIAFAPGKYRLTVAIYNEDSTAPYDFLDQEYAFEVISGKTVHGAMLLSGTWEG